MRHTLLAFAALLSLAACKVERTPREFYTQRDPAVVDQKEAAGEIRARVRSFAEELGRGDRAGAVEALLPQEGVLVIGVDAHDGVARLGPAGLAQALDSVELPVPSVARTPDLQVQVGLRDGTGSFSTPIELMPASGGDPVSLRASGVFAQQGGQWRLTQIHLSRPWTRPDTAAAERGDTTHHPRGDSARRATAAADSAPRPSRPRR